MVKLNIGCGNKKIHGFINIDTRPECNPDDDIPIDKISSKYQNVDLIYACHILEHLPKDERIQSGSPILADVLWDWLVALKPGGKLRIAVPDIEAVCKYYILTGNLSELGSFFNGGQKNPYDIHFNCWDFNSLSILIESFGFTNIKRYDWRKTEHNFIDDYSQSYLPHMDKVNGYLLSLNIEATKPDNEGNIVE